MTDTVDGLWQALRQHGKAMRTTAMTDLFAADPDRFVSCSLRCGDLLVDYSRNLVDGETLQLLRRTASLSGLEQHRDSAFSGRRINTTEDRAVLHTALRALADAVILVDGDNVVPGIVAERERALAFAEAIRSGAVTGFGGAAFRDIVHLGTGGSALGPALVVDALAPYRHPRIEVHFVGNADGADLHDRLRRLQPQTTLFLVVSKSFRTREVLLNARSARRWISTQLGESAVEHHFAAVSADISAAAGFGVASERLFPFRDWVGGRYSLWSSVGLSIALSVGAERFRELLAGARAMDEHFATEPMAANLPVVLGLIGIWYRSVLGHASSAIIPYDQRLARLPAHLQQLEMESNGKSVRLDGTPVAAATAGVVWGEVGTSAQHSFFQFMHQGCDVVPCDFLVAAEAHEDLPQHHEVLLANCLAQSQALMIGRSIRETQSILQAAGMDRVQAEALAPHRAFAGNRPSTTLLYRRLDPHTLGMLLALYEHKVLVQGVLWGINSFDQWGVELGKALADRLLPGVGGGVVEGADSSTLGLLQALRHWRPGSERKAGLPS